MAKKVESWEADDGSIHHEMQDALRADVKHGLRKLVEDTGMGRAGPWSAGMIADTLIENADRLKAILLNWT